MLRCALGLLLTLAGISSATASVNHKQALSTEKNIPLRSVRSLPAAGDLDTFRITKATEVLLDGRPTSYERIPKSATIILLETTTNESKEISRIHFRRRSADSKKP